MHPTDRPRGREAILRTLKLRGRQTAQALADALGITPVAVRKHLEALEAEGLVRVSTVKQPRGRPALLYQLTPAADALFPQGYRQLSLDLIADLVALDGEEKLEQLLRARNARVLQERVAPLDDPAQRVQELVRLRNEDGYMASVEEQPDSYVIREHNCPIYEVASRFPVACQCEADLFTAVVNKPVVREGSIVEGDESCTYRVPK
ncbi:MAG: metalloregulator ArsR/SmtB family transcription factor [Chloroflexota bacterium]|nr:transcriptional regulator [Dehalococcoidia bacterium]MDW8254634.1 metalloregulator ArsR/SmtB family transcription factor [Chloroflexota bacterium]